MQEPEREIGILEKVTSCRHKSLIINRLFANTEMGENILKEGGGWEGGGEGGEGEDGEAEMLGEDDCRLLIVNALQEGGERLVGLGEFGVMS